MTKNVFSVPIFFIVFRETLEAAIIISVLLGLVEQIVHEDHARQSGTTTAVAGSLNDEKKDGDDNAIPSLSPDLAAEPVDAEESELKKKRLIRKMRIQIFAGGFLGLFVALSIGAAFIAVWFTKASNLWSHTEELWEGIFELVACVLIFVMGITMLKMDHAKAKWRIKLQRAFDGKNADRGGVTGKWVLFILPLITVLREGLEAVVFVGGVSLGQPATSIPLAAVIGIICGLVCGWLIYSFASRTTLTIFLIVMTNFILLIGAGLFSKATGSLQENAFNHLVGQDVDDIGAAGDGPGSYKVQGNVWHLDCCNPDNNLDKSGWSIFNAFFGWTNNATIGSVLSYVLYWLAAIVVLIYLKWKEGRTKFFGKESAAGVWRRQRAALEQGDAEASVEKD